ncbi:MAG: peroxidase family protein, partial [Nocardioidaceae bacterium]
MVQVAGITPTNAAVAPVGQSFTVTPSDLSFILKQIKIAERHTATLTPLEPCTTMIGTAPNQIASPLVSQGLRTVDGSCNNLIPGQERFGSADQVFPRIAAKSFRDGEDRAPFGPPGQTFYRNSGDVVDSEPRVVSNLIVDQTSPNPAAVAAAGNPVRSQGNVGVAPCTTDPDPLATPAVEGVPEGCIPTGQTLFMPNVTTDVGLSPPYNSWFTLFGQFFDHGVDQTVKSGGTVFVPLKADDPLRRLGPDHKANTGDEVPASQAFMVLTRAKNVAGPGPDGQLGTSDDVVDATNTDSPWVDQSQTYTSHPSHQVFLRQYQLVNRRPVSTGKLLGGLPADGTYPGSPDGTEGISTWASTKKQAAEVLGLKLEDIDAVDIPMIAADPYGNFIPGPARGLPQYVTATGMVEGNLDAPVAVPNNVLHMDTPFLTDIAHNADPSQRDTNNNGVPDTFPTPDTDRVASADFANQPAGTYDDEMLAAHFACGDGRCNENIGLTAVHQVFHSEHDRLVDNITATLEANPTLKAQYQARNVFGADSKDISFGFGGRLFQAARFVTEMEYQHLVFEEFARKVQPAINPFEPFAFTQTELNPAIKAEFAHAVYRFGHSMLTDTISRHNEDLPGPDGAFGTPDDVLGTQNDISLLDGFLNPPAYFDGGPDGTLTPQEAAGSIVMGMGDQPGNELDEFVTETLRNNLLGLPLDLASVNMARARSEGVPSLNNFRRDVFEATNDGAMTPYTSWIDFGEHLKNPESLVNFVAAYGKHPSITAATTVNGKRDAARAIVDPRQAAVGPDGVPATADDIVADVQPDDAAAFMNSAPLLDASGAVVAEKDWSAKATGLDNVDLWVGGLAEVTNVFGGLLGST